MELQKVIEAIPLACAARPDLSQKDPKSNSTSPVSGFCALTSIFIRNYFGGTIARALMSNNITHYWNVLPGGVWLDATRAQFDPDVYPTYVMPNCPNNVYREGIPYDKYLEFEEEVIKQYNRLCGQQTRVY